MQITDYPLSEARVEVAWCCKSAPQTTIKPGFAMYDLDTRDSRSHPISYQQSALVSVKHDHNLQQTFTKFLTSTKRVNNKTLRSKFGILIL